MKKQLKMSFLTILFLVMGISACQNMTATPTVDQGNQSGEGLPPVAAVKARQELAETLDIEIEEVTIDSQKQVTWSDSCLGLGGPAESCLQAEVGGWLVELTANEATYRAHTDWLGEQIRFEP